MCKRAFDLAVSVPIVVMALPVMAFTAAVMAMDTKSVPILRQIRLGHHGKPFIIYKIKSMRDTTDDRGELLPDVERTSRLGIILRKSRLDELPQFFNVLKGDMSVVGPRPHMIRDIIWLDKQRTSIKPGITGLGKIAGFKAQSDKEELFWDQTYVHISSRLSPREQVVFDCVTLINTPFKILKHWSAPHSRQLRKQ